MTHKLETLEYRRLVRMSQAGGDIRSRLPELGLLLLDALNAAVTTLASLTARYASAAGRRKELSHIRSMVRDTLRLDVEAIVRTAQAIALDAPELDASKFRIALPGDQKLLTAARSALEIATPMAAGFVKHAMPANFLETLNAHIRDLEHVLEESAAVVRTCNTMGTRIATAIPEVLPAAKRFDAIVRNTLAGDSNALKQWDRACHLGRARPKATDPPAENAKPAKAKRKKAKPEKEEVTEPIPTA